MTAPNKGTGCLYSGETLWYIFHTCGNNSLLEEWSTSHVTQWGEGSWKFAWAWFSPDFTPFAFSLHQFCCRSFAVINHSSIQYDLTLSPANLPTESSNTGWPWGLPTQYNIKLHPTEVQEFQLQHYIHVNNLQVIALRWQKL